MNNVLARRYVGSSVLKLSLTFVLYDVHNAEEKEIVSKRIEQFTNDIVHTLTLNEDSNI